MVLHNSNIYILDITLLEMLPTIQILILSKSKIIQLIWTNGQSKEIHFYRKLLN